MAGRPGSGCSVLKLKQLAAQSSGRRISTPASNGPNHHQAPAREPPALIQRAAQRGIRPSRYVAALVRAHITASPPLTIEEISVLKRSVAVLAMLSRALSHTAQSIAQAGHPRRRGTSHAPPPPTRFDRQEQLPVAPVTLLRQRPPSKIAREDALDTSWDFTRQLKHHPTRSAPP